VGLLDLLDDVAPEPVEDHDDGDRGDHHEPDRDAALPVGSADGDHPEDPDPDSGESAGSTPSAGPDVDDAEGVDAEGVGAGGDGPDDLDPDAGPGPTGLDGATAAADHEPAAADGDATMPWDLTDREALVDDVHWAALRCIAELRADVPGGPRPVVLDDPFSVLEPAECVTVLARLARLTDLVQIVVVTDRPEVAEWALAIGPDHAAVVG
jgi:hypothetical protein